MTSKNTFDAKSFVASIKFPAKTFLTVDPKGGYLTVGGEGDVAKAKKVWEKAGASVTTNQLSQVRDLFAPKSGKTAMTGLQVWCMKCKCNVSLKNPIAQIKNGKAMTKGECEQCGGPVYSFKNAPDEPIHGSASLSPDKPMTKAQKAAYVKEHSKLSGKAKADATMMSNIEGMTEKRLDKWIASHKAQEAGVKTSAAKAEAKSAVTPKHTLSSGVPMFRGHKLDRVEIEAAVTEAYKEDRPKGATIHDLYFMLGKEKVNPKFALHLVTGVSVQEFTQVMAARVLAKVGIECLEVK